MIKVHILPVLQDNYVYILEGEKETAIIDPAESEPVIEYCQTHNLTPDFILNTHHHWDHISGNPTIKKTYNCPVIGPASEVERIATIDKGMTEQDTLTFDGESVRILETPGHTSGHICFYFPQSGYLFSADTLFVMGCGRLFEGTAEQMFASLQKIKALPDNTQIYGGHEYSVTNAKFSYEYAPDNQAVAKRLETLQSIRAVGKPTFPTTLKEEKETNLFLMAKTAEEFAAIRKARDHF